MKIYDSENIRNIAIAGHGDTGKTSLVSALVFNAGGTSRLGSVDEGNSVTDFDEEEIARKVTINTSLAYCESKNTKVNLLDTPGYRAFVLDAKGAMIAAEAALVVIDAAGGVEVQTELVWGYAEEQNLPRALVINKMDRERADFQRALKSIQDGFGRTAIPIQLPIGKEKSFSGIVDLIRNKAFICESDGSGKFSEADIPADLADEAAARREELIEMIAESDDSLMEKYFDEGTLGEADLIEGLRGSLREGTVHPIFVTAAVPNMGVKHLLGYLVDVFPNALQRAPLKVTDDEGEEKGEFEVTKDGATAAFVFKTLADPFAGRISMIKIFSGALASDSSIKNRRSGVDERLANLQLSQGKNHEPMKKCPTGDLCVALKLKDTTTGDTLAAPGFDGLFRKVEYPEPAISFAVEPKSRGDEDKIGSSIARIIEEDPSVGFRRDPETNEFLLSGSGQLHMEVCVQKLKNKYGVEVVLKPPKVPYRETITGNADVQGRHKKQTGGHGQFGDCRIRMEPTARGSGLEFENKIFGGSIPRNFIPAVEKGVNEAAAKGFLAGYPVVDFKVSLYDGSYHAVDSSEMAFKIAASLAFKKGMEKAKPVLLEPVMNVEIYVPEENAGDVMGDLNSRRGRIQGMDVKGNSQVVRAQVPFAEMLNYAPTLTSMTAGRGSYHMEMSHYDIVPHSIANKVIEQKKKEKEG